MRRPCVLTLFLLMGGCAAQPPFGMHPVQHPDRSRSFEADVAGCKEKDRISGSSQQAGQEVHSSAKRSQLAESMKGEPVTRVFLPPLATPPYVPPHVEAAFSTSVHLCLREMGWFDVR
jgi:hypothetical protein